MSKLFKITFLAVLILLGGSYLNPTPANGIALCNTIGSPAIAISINGTLYSSNVDLQPGTPIPPFINVAEGSTVAFTAYTIGEPNSPNIIVFPGGSFSYPSPSSSGRNYTTTPITSDSTIYIHMIQNCTGGTPPEASATINLKLPVINTVNGLCSNPEDYTNPCSKGTSSTITTGSSGWTWSCFGSNGGSTASCSQSSTSFPINCAGDWGACVNGTKTYTISQPALNGGVPCSFANGVTQSCSTIVNCEGYWSTCVNGSQTYTITTPASGGGVSCPSSPRACGTLPDLTAGAVTPTTAALNVAQTYTATISNIGTATTGVSFPYFFQTATDKTSSTMTALIAGGSNTATSPSITFTSAGIHSIRVCADKVNSSGGGVVLESDEDNNCGPWTDVTVLGDSATGCDYVGCYTDVSGDVRNLPDWLNRPSTNANRDSCVQLAIDGNSGNGYSYAGLQYGGYCFGGDSLVGTKVADSECNMPCTSDSGEICGGALRNSICRVPVTLINGVCSSTHYDCSVGTSASNNYNSGNNTYTWDCVSLNGGATDSCSEFPSGPDLTASDVAPTTANINVAQTYSATISNIGGVSTGKSFPYFFQTATASNGGGTVTDKTSSTMTTLASGGSNTATSPSITFTSAGTYSVRVCADKTSDAGGDIVSESNEGNNCGAWTDVTVAGVPAITVNLTANPFYITISSPIEPPVEPPQPPPGGGSETSWLLPNKVYAQASPTTGSTTLNWTTSGSPDSCVASGSWSGSKTASGGSQLITGLTVGTYTYTITCSKIGLPNVSSTATVTVVNRLASPATIKASPTTIVSGDSTILTWTSSAASCVGSTLPEIHGFNTNNLANGSVTVRPPSTTTYKVTCGTQTQSASVKVTVKKKPIFEEN